METLAAVAPPRTPLGELTSLPRPTSCWGEGWLPVPKNPTSALGPAGLGLRPLGRTFLRLGRKKTLATALTAHFADEFIQSTTA